MISMTLLEIERSIGAMPLADQLWLVERIADNLREQTSRTVQIFNSEDRSEQLAAMASDPDIQAELVAINKEFAGTDMDGLR